MEMNIHFEFCIRALTNTPITGTVETTNCFLLENPWQMKQALSRLCLEWEKAMDWDRDKHLKTHEVTWFKKLSLLGIINKVIGSPSSGSWIGKSQLVDNRCRRDIKEKQRLKEESY